MIKFTPIAVTAEEAVARLINFNYLPSTYSLFDMTSAFAEEAEVAYENSIASHSSENDIESLKFRMEACRHRHQLATMLHESIRRELNKKGGVITRAGHHSSIIDHLDWDSVQEWADNQYGISIPALHHNETLPCNVPKDTRDALKKERTGLSRKVADGLYLAFYCLVEMYSKNHVPVAKNSKGGINVSYIAEEIYKHAASESKEADIEGLSAETIKTRIEDAKKVKLSTLSGK